MAASPEYIEQYALAFAAVFYVSDIIAVLEAGLQIFMCVYGLSSFLGTPPERRKGRLPYVFLSFLILFLSVIPTGIDLSATVGPVLSHKGKSHNLPKIIGFGIHRLGTRGKW
ncbi:hypothetical protein CC2G_004380 [Coprinopsis cinerea AmutBmut pab1-1]|nr:hypothetical protein CC2G_004380 [Coprinopsis cinerea AmutBmut pab1-1]